MKLLKEVKQKLKLLQPGGKFNKMLSDGTFNAAQMLEGENEDEDMGDVASPEQMAMRGKAGK